MTFTKEDAQRVLEQVKGNIAKLDGCQRHLFSGLAPPIGKKKCCDKCGGEMSLPDIGLYIRGYEAAGNSAIDIWPEYGRAKARH